MKIVYRTYIILFFVLFCLNLLFILKYCGYAAAMQWQKRSLVRHSRNESRSEEIPTRI